MVPISKKTAECFRTGGGPGEERRPVGKRHAFLWKAAAEKSGGTRLLDYVDLHTYFSYTGTTNLAFSTAGDTSVQQARMNSTRVSWDPAYTDPNFQQPNYTTDANYTASCTTVPLQAPQVIPMMKGWVAKDYPGT